jgi:trehalose 6-phosphate synthase
VQAVKAVVVASNRGPLSFGLDDQGRPVATGSGGGLAGTLHPLLAGSGATWVAASMNEADRLASEQGLMTEEGLRIITLEPDERIYRQAYDVVSNAALWFCHHHLFDLSRRPRFDHRWAEAWGSYRELNEMFAEAIAQEAAPEAVVLVQDYHLALTGRMLADRRPDLRTVHFTHTPFGDPSALRVLPSRFARELLDGMAGFGATGFHTARWEAAFRSCFSDPELTGGVRSPGPPRTFVSPLGPDPAALATEAAAEAVERARAELATTVGDRSLMLRVDRVELSKNLIRGFLAFEELLQRHPEWRERVVFLALAYASREGLAEYLSYRSEMEHVVDRINEAWGTGSWTPIVLDVADNRDRSVAALRRYDVLLVNPVRDGMNLVAKEGPLINERDGVLVLSREAGAVDELASVSTVVNPFDLVETADAMHSALAMDAAVRAQRAAALRERVAARTAADWLDDQIAQAQPPS